MRREGGEEVVEEELSGLVEVELVEGVVRNEPIGEGVRAKRRRIGTNKLWSEQLVQVNTFEGGEERGREEERGSRREKSSRVEHVTPPISPHMHFSVHGGVDTRRVGTRKIEDSVLGQVEELGE